MGVAAVSDCLTCAVENYILDTNSWDWWAYQDVGYTSVGLSFDVVVLQIVKGDEGSNGYDEYPQGYEGTCSILFKVGDTFFKKLGTVDSYCARSWDGRFIQVYPTAKIVTTYEDGV